MKRDLTKSQFLNLIQAALDTDQAVAKSRTQLGIAIGKALAKHRVRATALGIAKRLAKLHQRDPWQASEDLRQLLLFCSYLGIEPVEPQEEIERDERQADQVEARP